MKHVTKRLLTMALMTALLIPAVSNEGTKYVRAEGNQEVPAIPEETPVPQQPETPTVEPVVTPVPEENTPAPEKQDSKKDKKKKKVSYVTIKTITISDQYLSVRVGEPLKLSYQLKPKKASYKDVKFTFSKKYKDFFEVNKKGVMKAKKKGVGKTFRVNIMSQRGKQKAFAYVHILPKIDPKKKMIAITYDDGPDAIWNHKIVQTLIQYNAAGTFFTIGNLAGSKAGQKELQFMAKNGMEIGNHSQTHKQLSIQSDEGLRYEIDKCDSMIKKALGKKPALMRTPYGDYSQRVLDFINRPMILWSIDTLDWQSLNADSVYQRTMSQARDGSIVLMHSIYSSTYSATKRIMPALKARGFQFVTVSELFQYKRHKLKNRKAYCNA